MLNIYQIEQYYPEKLRGFKKNILREYLQYKILEVIFNSEYAKQLSFLGGTALRIVYGNTRFSEDIDFDNFNLSKKDFSIITEKIKKELEDQGYKTEVRNVFKDAYRCYIKMPEVLFNNEISKLQEEKITIQFDTVPHNFNYQPDNKILNKFDVFTQIFVTPLDILLSQKIYAVFNRKRTKGRDFFDIVFLMQKTKPNFEYLESKTGLKNPEELKRRLMEVAKKADLDRLAKDVEPFLFNSSDSKRIKMFSDYINDYSFL